MELAPEVQRDLLARLSRIEGQARGVQRMIADGRECADIVRQLAAMRAALARVAVAVIGENLEECMRHGLSAEPELARAKQALLELV